MTDSHQTHHKQETPDRTSAMISNGLAIAGFIVLIIIIVWGLAHIASLSSGLFPTLFKSSSKGITVHAPASVTSGAPAQITWKGTGSGAGRYAFLYECAGGLTFGIPVVKNGESGVTLARVPCGATFTLGNATSSVVVVPILTASSSLVAHMSVVFLPNAGTANARGSANMMVAALVAHESPKPTPETAQSAGPTDLAISIVSANTDSSGTSVVTFDIANDGASPTGTYVFSADLPTAQSYTYISDPQASLAPGSHIVNTLRFTRTVNGIFTVYADPSNLVRESNEHNNTTSQSVSMPYQNSYNSYNYNVYYNNTYTPNGYPVYY